MSIFYNYCIPLTLTLALSLASAITSANNLPVQLERFAWENRIVLLFAPDKQSQTLQEALQEWSSLNCQIQERNLVLGILLESGQSSLNQQALSRLDQQQLRQFYGANTGSFTAILIGKDRYEKYRDQQFDATKLFDLIDGMPMRLIEMEESSSNCKR